MGAKSCIITGGILIALGLIVGIGWLFGCVPLINSLADKKLRQNLVVDSYDAIGYDDWVQGTAQRNWNYYVYSFWNMTNPDDVMTGAPPEYEEVGPFYYRYYWYNKNATFSDNGNKVEYSLLEDYIFESGLSHSDPTETYITNINPAYLGLMVQTGSEVNMAIAGVRPQMINVVNFLTGPYLEIVTSQYTPLMIANTSQHVIDQIKANSTIDAEQCFFTMWANATSIPDINADWQGMLVSISGTPSNLPMVAVQSLFNATVTLSLLDSSADSVMTWYNAAVNASGDEAELLSASFNISMDQVSMVAQWRTNTFAPIYVHAYLLDMARQNYADANWTDIGWLQYTNVTFTQPDFFTFFGKWFPEFPSSFETYGTIHATMEQVKNVCVGPFGIFDVDDFSDFMAVLQSTQPLTKWGLIEAQRMEFVSYITGGNLVMDYSIATIQPIVNSGGSGLLVTKSVDYWLWRCLDPLVEYIAGAANASCTLQFNHTAQPHSQIWTGKDDEKKINKYVKWREQTVISGMYAKDVPVEGCAENGQFALRLKDGDDLTVFDESLYKTITLNQMGKTSIRGIDVYKYVFSDTAFNASDLYINNIQGFANVSVANQGVPVFLSNWDLYDVQNSNYSDIKGMRPDKENVTILLVEPFTGNTLKADMKLQVNFYLPPDAGVWFAGGPFDHDYSQVKYDCFFPTLKAWQKSEVGDQDANKLITQLKPLQPKFLTAIRFGIVGGAVFFLLLGIVLVIRGKQLKQRNGYTNIQDYNLYN